MSSFSYIIFVLLRFFYCFFFKTLSILKIEALRITISNARAQINFWVRYWIFKLLSASVYGD